MWKRGHLSASTLKLTSKAITVDVKCLITEQLYPDATCLRSFQSTFVIILYEGITFSLLSQPGPEQPVALIVNSTNIL
jgi:hypothetical protein